MKSLENLSIQKLMTVQQVAECLECSPRHVTRMVSNKQFPAPIKIGRLSRWKPQVIENWLLEHSEN